MNNSSLETTCHQLELPPENKTFLSNSATIWIPNKLQLFAHLCINNPKAQVNLSKPKHIQYFLWWFSSSWLHCFYVCLQDSWEMAWVKRGSKVTLWRVGASAPVSGRPSKLPWWLSPWKLSCCFTVIATCWTKDKQRIHHLQPAHMGIS